MSFEPDSIPTRSPSAAGVRVDGDTVLINRTTGRLHLLNDVGVAIWSRLDGQSSVGSIAGELSQVSGGDPDRVRRDVDAFLTRLAQLGLVHGAVAREPSASLEPGAQPLAGAPAGSSWTLTTVWVDWYTAQVVDALREHGIEAVLLKGPAIRRWLYEDAPGERAYLDADLLVSPRSLESAAGVLRELGFRREDPPGAEAISPWATAWRRDSDGAVVDLHRTLHGCEYSSVDPWPIVRATTVEEEVGGTDVLMPSVAVRAVEIVLVSPADRPWRKWDDLGRVLERLSDEQWRDAAEVAKALGVERRFGYRLSQSPAGPEAARRIGVPSAPRWWLRWETDPVLAWAAVLAELPNWRARMRLARELARRPAGYSYAAWATRALRLVPRAVLTLVGYHDRRSLRRS